MIKKEIVVVDEHFSRLAKMNFDNIFDKEFNVGNDTFNQIIDKIFERSFSETRHVVITLYYDIDAYLKKMDKLASLVDMSSLIAICNQKRTYVSNFYISYSYLQYCVCENGKRVEKLDFNVFLDYAKAVEKELEKEI